MQAIEIENDKQYYKWLEQNPNGFVVNTTRGHSANYMVLHRVSCGSISEPMHEHERGGFTERSYTKICAPNVESLRDWAAQHGRPDRSFSKECSICNPTG